MLELGENGAYLHTAYLHSVSESRTLTLKNKQEKKKQLNEELTKTKKGKNIDSSKKVTICSITLVIKWGKKSYKLELNHIFKMGWDISFVDYLQTQIQLAALSSHNIPPPTAQTGALQTRGGERWPECENKHTRIHF